MEETKDPIKVSTLSIADVGNCVTYYKSQNPGKPYVNQCGRMQVPGNKGFGDPEYGVLSSWDLNNIRVLVLYFNGDLVPKPVNPNFLEWTWGREGL